LCESTVDTAVGAGVEAVSVAGAQRALAQHGLASDLVDGAVVLAWGVASSVTVAQSGTTAWSAGRGTGSGGSLG